MKTFYFAIEHHTLKFAKIREPYGCEEAARNDLNMTLRNCCGGAARVKQALSRKPRGVTFFVMSNQFTWAEFGK